MNRENEFAIFLVKNNRPTKYIGYCKRIEEAFEYKDMDCIIASHRNISSVRGKLKKSITKNDNSIAQYIVALNAYLEFALSTTATIPIKAVSAHATELYHVARAPGVPLTSEVEFVCRILENEYAKIIRFAKDLLMQGCFDTIPIIVSDEMPMRESPDGGEKVLGCFFCSAKPYIEIYYRNFTPRDAASIRNCLAHEYLHYLHYVFAGKEYKNADKQLKEGLADFFRFIYSIHRQGNDDLKVAKERYNRWKKNFGTYWPYAKALYFFQIGGNEMAYSANYAEYVKHGCLKKFVQVFFSVGHPIDAYKAMLQ